MKSGLIRIIALKESSLRDKVKIMVGGSAITDKFAQDIGAGEYDPTVSGAVTLARKLHCSGHRRYRQGKINAKRVYL